VKGLQQLFDALTGLPVAHRAAVADALDAVARDLRIPQEATLQKLARLETSMRDSDTGERVETICSRLGISRATYYRWRVECVDRGLLQSHSLTARETDGR
jgi:hypothetical protein